MGNAIQNTGAQANANGLTDMLNRLTGGKQGDDGNAESFARWMSQHQASQTTGLPASSPNRAMPQPTAAPPRMAGGGSTTPPAARLPQARAGAGMQSAAKEPENAPSSHATRSESRPTKPRQEAAAKPAQRANGASKSPSPEEGANDESARADRTQEASSDVTRFTTNLGEASAEVRELTPPAEVQANDSASMMAWLVSLTQNPTAAPPVNEGALQGDAKLEEGSLEESLGMALTQDGERNGPGGARDLTPGSKLGVRDLAQDLRASASSASASLQVDALLGRGAAATGQDSDALSSFMAADVGRATFAQTLSQASATRHEQAAIPVPLNAPDFSQKLADQVSLWVGQVRQEGPMTAELHLNPAEMGPINVKISLDGSAAHVDFAAAALETRQAIEASLSALSSSLNEVGISLSGGGVSSQTQQSLAQGGQAGQQGQGGRGPAASAKSSGTEDDGGDPIAMRQVSVPRSNRVGGLDLYA
jgi:flagellar hook-length control protein FliK